MSSTQNNTDPYSIKRFLYPMVAILAIVFSLLIYGGLRVYESYRDELVESEEKQLLMMAETIGHSLVNYVDQEMDSLDLYFDSLPDDQELDYVLDYYINRFPKLYDGVICYNMEGEELHRNGKIYFAYENLPGNSFRSTICGKYYMPEGRYQVYIARTFRYQGEWMNAVYAMNLSRIHQMIVAPVKIGGGGYSVVKDEELAIIMHHASDQIGMDAVYDRRVRYPQLDLTDLFDWINMQKEQDSGYRIITSYVWDDPALPQLQRLVAYTKIHLRGDCWIVNSTLPYEELDTPLANMTMRILGMSGLFAILMLLSAAFITRSYMRADQQKREIEYLKEINAGMELLRRKEEEIQHYQRVQSLGEMSSHIAHEFNNYLTPIIVYGEILQEEPNLKESQVEMVKGILDVAHQAADLSRRLLDFSRQDNEVVLSPICINRDVATAGKVLRQLTPRSVNYQLDIPDEEMHVMGRAGMMEHILLNMGKNAFHAMEKDGREDHHLQIRLERGSGESEGMAVLSIADDGCGIPKDAMDKLFEPFYTTKRSGKGTGLGLSVVKNLVTASGGSIRIDSTVGEGTTFYLSFPLCISKEEVVKKKVARRKGNDKIALVDDDPQILKSLRQMLENRGYEVHTYEHPAAVAAKLQNSKSEYDVLITDYWMPTMTGLELAEIVQKLNPEMRIILISGMEDSRFAWYEKNKIIDAFVLKSEIVDKLVAAITDTNSYNAESNE